MRHFVFQVLVSGYGLGMLSTGAILLKHDYWLGSGIMLIGLGLAVVPILADNIGFMDKLRELYAKLNKPKRHTWCVDGHCPYHGKSRCN